MVSGAYSCLFLLLNGCSRTTTAVRKFGSNIISNLVWLSYISGFPVLVEVEKGYSGSDAGVFFLVCAIGVSFIQN